MGYAIYEDDATNRARIHVVTCRHYIKRKPIRLPDNRWHGPFDSLEAAWAKVRSLGSYGSSEGFTSIEGQMLRRED